MSEYSISLISLANAELENISELFAGIDDIYKTDFCHHPSWYIAYYQNIDKGKTDAKFIIVRSVSDVVAIIPVEECSVSFGFVPFKYAQLYYPNELGICDFLSVIPIKKYWKELKEYLRSQGVCAFRFQHIATDSNAVKMGVLRLCQFSKVSHFSKWIDCSSSYEEFLSSYNGKFKRNLRRKHNKAVEIAPLTLRLYEERRELEEGFDIFLALEDSGWKGDQGTSVVKQDDMFLYYKGLLSGFSQSSHCLISALYLGDRPIAALFGTLISGRVSLLKIAYEEEYKDISPGHLLINEMVKRGEKDDRYQRVSFITGTSWTDIWKPQRTPVYVGYAATSLSGFVFISLLWLRNKVISFKK